MKKPLMPISINECYFVKSDGVLISTDSLFGMAFGNVQPGAPPDVKRREPCLPPSLPPPQNLQLHTRSCLTENHSSVSWAMLPAASNKTSLSPSPALGKQTWLGPGRAEDAGDHIPRPFCRESRSCSLGIHHHQQSSADPSSSPSPTEGLLVSCSLALSLTECGLMNECVNECVCQCAGGCWVGTGGREE